MTMDWSFLRRWGPIHNEECAFGVLYFCQHHGDKPSLTTEEIRDALLRARVPKASKINVTDVPSKSGAIVDSLRASQGIGAGGSLRHRGKAHVRAEA